jgi:putative transposase
LTEGRGVPVGVAVAGANVNDYKLAEETLESMPVPRPDPRGPAEPEAVAEQGLCLDADYYRVAIYELLDEWGYTAHIRPVGGGADPQLD